MNTPDIYVDFANGLTHGISCANNIHLTPEALATLTIYIDGGGKLEASDPELCAIREIHLKSHRYEVAHWDDFEFGFWFGVINRWKRGE